LLLLLATTMLLLLLFGHIIRARISTGIAQRYEGVEVVGGRGGIRGARVSAVAQMLLLHFGRGGLQVQIEL